MQFCGKKVVFFFFFLNQGGLGSILNQSLLLGDCRCKPTSRHLRLLICKRGMIIEHALQDCYENNSIDVTTDLSVALSQALFYTL